MLSKKLWDKISPHVFENIYLPAAQFDSSGYARQIFFSIIRASTILMIKLFGLNRNAGFRVFNVTVDIKLKQWAEQLLPGNCVNVGWETLKEEFRKLVDKSKTDPSHDGIFDKLKATIIDEALDRHKWEGKAADTLVRGVFVSKVILLAVIDIHCCLCESVKE